MAHFIHDTKSRAAKTPREWLKVGASIGDFVNERAGRTDIIAFVGEGAGGGAAACFNPALAEIELNVAKAFVEGVKPEWINPFSERTTLFDNPRAAGALIHEAGHARWTTWNVMDMVKLKMDRKNKKSPKIAGIVEFMEESRIEALAARTWPTDRAFLRTSALEIVLEDINLAELRDGSAYELSRLMLLTSARVDANVLDQSDIQELHDIYVDVFTKDVYDKMRSLWLKAQMITDHTAGFDKMVPLAKEWLELLPEEADFELPQELQDLMQQIGEMIQDAQDSAEIGGSQDAYDQEDRERTQASVEAANRAAAENREHEETAKEVFAKSTEDLHGALTDSRITERRQPTGPERAAAVKLAKDLERARYTDRVSIDTKTMVPPGRLHTRTAIQGMAQRAKGTVVTAEPWERTLRRHVEDPNLTIGCMVDISGSMNSAMAPMAVTAWGVAEAGHRVDAKTAQVYYGNSVFPTLKVGQRMKEIVVRSARDSTEKFNTAFKALNGELQLLNGTGARMLVICSDTCYTYHEAVALKKWVARCIKAGVAVVILPFDGGYDVEQHGLPSQVQVIKGTLTTQQTLAAIGDAAVKGLQAVNGKR